MFPNIQRPKGAHVPVDASGAWPIGSVFISIVSTNPATLLGFGTWSAFGAGRVMVGLDSGDTDFDTAEETGGAKTVQSSAQTFAGNALGTHQHAAITAGTPSGSVAAPSDHTAHTHTGPSHQHNLSGGAATVHNHTYTSTLDHVHAIDSLRGATTGTDNTVGSGLTAGVDTSSTKVSHNSLNPTGSAGATGTTANNAAGATDNAGTGATGNPSATLTHNAPAFTGDALATHQHAAITAGTPAGTNTAGAATSVVQPYIVCYFWKRTA
jgi:hypothetical protein